MSTAANTAPEDAKRAAELEKAAIAAHRTVMREVYLPVFAKVASSYGVPVPRDDERLSKLMDMAYYLGQQKRAAAASAPNPIDRLYEGLRKEAGAAAPAVDIQPIQAAQSMITDDVAEQLAKSAVAAIAGNLQN